MKPTVNQTGKTDVGKAPDELNRRGSLNGGIDKASPSPSTISSSTPLPGWEPITGTVSAIRSSSVLAEADNSLRAETGPKTTSAPRRRSSTDDSDHPQIRKPTSKVEGRAASSHIESHIEDSQPDSKSDSDRSGKWVTRKQVFLGASARNLLQAARSPCSPTRRLSRRVSFTLPEASATTAPWTDTPVKQKNHAQLIAVADQILNLLSESESPDTFSALQMLRHQFHQAPEKYEAFSDILLQRCSTDPSTLSGLIKQAERDETVAMESTFEATLVSTSETDKKIVTLKTRLADITSDSGAPLPGKEQIAKRYRQTIEDLQVALDAATQAEGPTQKLWTGGAKHLQPEDNPFLTQFKELLAEGTFEDQLAFINSVRSIAVLTEIEKTLKFGFYDQRLIDANADRLQWSSQLTSPSDSPVSQRLPADVTSWQPVIRFEVPVNRMKQYLKRNDFKAAAEYVRRQSNPEIKAHIMGYLHTLPEAERQVFSHLNTPHLSKSNSDSG